MDRGLLRALWAITTVIALILFGVDIVRLLAGEPSSRLATGIGMGFFAIALVLGTQYLTGRRRV